MERTHPQDTTVSGERVLQRIAALTLGLGAAAAVCALALRRLDWAEGLFGGAVLAWLNFRWLRRGIMAMMQIALANSETPLSGSEESTASGKASTYSPAAVLTLLFRYALVALGVYAIFNYLHVPLASIGLGLCALVAAIMAASVWEVVTPEN